MILSLLNQSSVLNWVVELPHAQAVCYNWSREMWVWWYRYRG